LTPSTTIPAAETLDGRYSTCARRPTEYARLDRDSAWTVAAEAEFLRIAGGR
jgi:hypothetical protein